MYCQGCGQANPNFARFCSACGSPLPPAPAEAQTGPQPAPAAAQSAPAVAPLAPLRPVAPVAAMPAPAYAAPAAPVAPVAAPAQGYAGFWRRLFALVVDTVPLAIGGAAIVTLLANNVTGMEDLLSGELQDLDSLAADGAYLTWLPALLLGWLYYALMESSGAQATPGKMLLGIRVVDQAGQRISFGRATLRYLAKFVSAGVFMLGYLMAAFTGRKQALHDMIAGCLVVRRDASNAGAGRSRAQPRSAGPTFGRRLGAFLIGLLLVLFGLHAPLLQIVGEQASATVTEVTRSRDSDSMDYVYEIDYRFRTAGGESVTGSYQKSQVYNMATLPRVGARLQVRYLSALPALNIASAEAGNPLLSLGLIALGLVVIVLGNR